MERQADLDRPHLDLLTDLVFPPVFIMGDHRSGTTILYKILGATQCFNIITAYHIIKYDELLHNYVNHTVENRKEQLSAFFEQRGLWDRGIDRLQISPDMPEEYGFILNTNFRQQLRPDNLGSLLELCKKVQLTSNPTRPLLLKNPWDYFLNFPYVKQAFPASKFIFIHRHPIDIINSQLKAIRSALRVKNEYVALIADWYNQIFDQPLRLHIARFLFSSHFDIGLRIVTRHVARATDYFVRHAPSLPRQDYVCVKYEDLCPSPRSTVMGILDSLGLEENVAVEYESFIEVRTDPLPYEVEKKRESVYTRMKPYYEYCGYEQ